MGQGVVVVGVDDADGDSVVFGGWMVSQDGRETCGVGVGCVLVLCVMPSAGKAMEYWAGPPWKVRWTMFRNRARSSMAAAEAVLARPRARARGAKDFIVSS